jgi:hypothetical protein
MLLELEQMVADACKLAGEAATFARSEMNDMQCHYASFNTANRLADIVNEVSKNIDLSQDK